jgi:uncharacterized membrane protein YfcA
MSSSALTTRPPSVYMRATLRTHTYVREREYRDLVMPMGTGSALGAVIGGCLLVRATSSFLAFALGAVLIASAVTGFQSRPSEWTAGASRRREA